MDRVKAAVIATVVSVGLYAALRRLPVDTTADVTPTERDSEMEPRLGRAVSLLGRDVAAILNIIVAGIAVVSLGAAPSAVGLGLFGFFAPLAVTLSLIAIGSRTGSAGLTPRKLRGVIAATCGLALFTAITAGVAAIGPMIAALTLAAFDPVLGAFVGALGL